MPAFQGLRSVFVAALALLAAHSGVARDHLALLGTYTDHGSRGIYAVHLDADTGALSKPELMAEIQNPEFLALHPNGRIVYALTQVAGAAGRSSGAVAALALDPATGHLTLLNTVSTGRDPLTHLAVDATGRMIVAASYNGGYVVSFPLDATGRIGAVATVLEQKGPLGPNHARQDAPHPHCVTLSPDNRFAFVADLGLDRVFSYRLDPAHGTIVPNDPAFTSLAPGVGPRHSAFSPDGRFFYVVDELEGSVTTCQYDATRGALTVIARETTLPADFHGANTSSEICVHPNGRHVYAANRGPNTLASFARDPATGQLTRATLVPSGGDNPRSFALTPDGTWLLCAHQTSDNLTVFRVDPASGALARVRPDAQVPTAVCVLFLR